MTPINVESVARRMKVIAKHGGDLYVPATEVIALAVKGAEMKRLITETEDDGFSPLMGEVVTLLCANYFYTGKLIRANSDFVELEDPAIVYETGEWTAKAYKDVQALGCKTLRVRVAAIESYGIIK